MTLVGIKESECCYQSIADARCWAEKVWAEAEEKWLVRDGQHHFYTDYVVIPGLMHCIQRICSTNFIELVDIGCGDGYLTEHLVTKMLAAGIFASRVLLLDCSQIKLEIASGRSNLSNAMPIRCNLNDCNWFVDIPPYTCQRIFISVFSIQELPALDNLLFGLESIVSQHDIVLLLTVAPKYSELLLREGKILHHVQGTINDDWHWRGLYPIDGAAGRLYLPHFHRTVEDYLQSLNAYGFHNIGTCYLSVPNSQNANSFFSKTIYGRRIIGKQSSMILTIKKMDTDI